MSDFPSLTPQTNGADTLVDKGFVAAQGYAQTAFSEALGFISELGSATAQLAALPYVDGTLGPVNDAIVAYTPPVLPDAPGDLTVNMPAVPQDPTLTAVAIPDLGSAPQFTATLPVLDLDQPEPAPLTATVPLAPTLAAIVVPSDPNIVLPEVPNLLGIEVPSAPLLAIPTFTAVTPQHPLAAQYNFAFAEPTYQSPMLTDLRNILQTWVDGADTGIAPAVEQRIWDAARTREYFSLQRKLKESFRQFATKGFTKPPGALAADLNASLQDSQSTLSGLSRDISIKQADLEQSNRRFAFEQVWKVEEGLITYQNQIAQRAFETAKFVQQVAIDIYHETVVAYVADIQAYSAQVDLYKAQIQAALTNLDVYKAQLEGQRLISELNVQTIQIYTAQIDAAKALVDIFKTTVDADNVKASINKTIIDAFASQVGAYAETVRAKTAEYDGYATLINAQVAKATVFKTQADAYTSQVTGFRATVDAATAQANLALRIGQEVPLELFKARTEVFRDQVTAETSRVDAVARVYGAQTQAYSASVSGEASRVSSDVAIFRGDIDLAVAQGNLRIEAAKSNVQEMLQQITLLVESIKSGGQVAAQLAAAALSSINLSAQLGDHYTFSDSNSNATSASVSSSAANNTQTSQLTSTSTGNNTNTNYNYSV